MVQSNWCILNKLVSNQRTKTAPCKIYNYGQACWLPASVAKLCGYYFPEIDIFGNQPMLIKANSKYLFNLAN